MKKALLLFMLFLLLSNCSFAQNYQSIFGTQSTSWIIEWGNLFGQRSSTISVQKDTVVNNILFKKIVCNIPSYYRGGLLREDQVGGKIWYRAIRPFLSHPDDSIERIVFDFSLSKGDTFDISNGYPGFPGTYPDSLNIVDTVYYKNNLKHIEFKSRVNFGSQEPLTFIEGIGGNKGIIYKDFGGGMLAQYLLCSYKDGVKTSYSNKQYNGNCSITDISEQEQEEPFVKIYPNPVTDFLYLPGGTNFSQITVSDLSGKVLLRETKLFQRLDLSTFSAGIYIVSLHQQGKVQHVRIVKA